jgi:hypothetical protein
VARSRGIDRRSRDGGRAACRRASVTLTPPPAGFSRAWRRSRSAPVIAAGTPAESTPRTPASSVECSTKQPELGRFKREPASPRGCRSRKCSIRARTGGSASSSYCRPSWPVGSIWRPRHGQPAPARCHFGVILADARWRLESWGPKGQRCSASRHYDVLTPTRGPLRAGFAREQSHHAEEPPAAPPQ